MSNSAAIGIDLGTSYSCVSILQDGKVEIITNDHGNRLTPNYISFSDTGRLIGDSAKGQAIANPSNTIFGIHRLIGYAFEDGVVQTDKNYWPFDVVNTFEGLQFKVEFKKKSVTFTPEELLAMLLGKLKQIAENYLGNQISDAVITVPASFTSSQRWTVIDSASIVNLKVLRIICGPTAAGLAFGFEYQMQEGKTERNVLVFDVGGGTTNVTILNFSDGLLRVKCCTGHNHLGGEDFNNELVAYLLKEFERRHNKDLSTNKSALMRLTNASEEAKRNLSSVQKTSIDLNSLDGIDFHTSITRDQFEALNHAHFLATLEPLHQALYMGNLDKSEIDDIVLVGGSTRIPKIRTMVQSFFGGKELNTSLNPDEAAAVGAAIQAAILCRSSSSAVNGLLLLDVTHHDIGYESAGGVMTTVVMKNTIVPSRQTQILLNYHGNVIRVFEGQSALADNNNFIGELRGIPFSSNPCSKVEITFDVDCKNHLTVSACEKFHGLVNSANIANTNTRLSPTKIERMTVEAKDYFEQDVLDEGRLSAKNELEDFCLNLTNIGDEINSACQEVVEWIEQNSSSPTEDFENKQIFLKKFCRKMVNRLRFELSQHRRSSDGDDVSSNGSNEQETRNIGGGDSVLIEVPRERRKRRIQIKQE